MHLVPPGTESNLEALNNLFLAEWHAKEHQLASQVEHSTLLGFSSVDASRTSFPDAQNPIDPSLLIIPDTAMQMHMGMSQVMKASWMDMRRRTRKTRKSQNNPGVLISMHQQVWADVSCVIIPWHFIHRLPIWGMDYPTAQTCSTSTQRWLWLFSWWGRGKRMHFGKGLYGRQGDWFHPDHFSISHHFSPPRHRSLMY